MSRIRRPRLKGAVAALGATVAFIGGWEGTRLAAYRDVVGVPTICQGLTEGVKMGDTATQEECDARFAVELARYERGIAGCVRDYPKLPVRTRIALVSWTYNVGIHGACNSTAVRRFNAGNYRSGCDAVKWWDKGTVAGRKVRIPGLTNRRAAEHRLCVADLP